MDRPLLLVTGWRHGDSDNGIHLLKLPLQNIETHTHTCEKKHKSCAELRVLNKEYNWRWSLLKEVGQRILDLSVDNIRSSSGTTECKILRISEKSIVR